MLNVDGVSYLCEKEIVAKYGLSKSWLRHSRFCKKSPPYHRLNGRIYYVCDEVTKWLKDKLK